MVAANLQRPAFRCAVVAMDLIRLVSRVALLCGEIFHEMRVAPSPEFVVDGLPCKAQLPCNLCHRDPVPAHSFQLVPLITCHVVSHEYLQSSLNEYLVVRIVTQMSGSDVDAGTDNVLQAVSSRLAVNRLYAAKHEKEPAVKGTVE